MPDDPCDPYNEETATLDSKIGMMGRLTEKLVAEACHGLTGDSPTRASAIVAGDSRIHELHREIEEQIIAMMVRCEPATYDSRQAISVLKIAAELDRICDLSENITKRALTISGEHYPKELLTSLRLMGKLASEQLHDVLDAYAARDADRAMAVWRNDHRLDEVYNSVFRQLLTYMMENPRNIGLCAQLLFVAKNLERIGDHTTNIAEPVNDMTRGAPPEGERPKSDLTSSALPKFPSKHEIRDQLDVE